MSVVGSSSPRSYLTPDIGPAMKAGAALSADRSRDLSIAVSAQERARGQLLPETERAVCAAFRRHGCLFLRGAFAPALIGAMYHDFLSRYGALNAHAMLEETKKPPPNPFVERGDARFQITPRMNGAIGSAEVFANALLRRIMISLLGDDMQVNSFTLVVSHPGAPLQPIHRDHSPLFADPGVSTSLPVYAINVIVPLMDTELAAGPTGVWPGSHQWPLDIKPQPGTVTASALQRGDCIFLDYRTLHAGLANRSAITRPIACMVYAHSWFFEDINHFGMSPFDLPPEEQDRLPRSMRPLLGRVLSQAMRRQTAAAASAGPARAAGPAAADVPSVGKVGRNDPCRCGSGRKFKQCHGRLA